MNSELLDLLDELHAAAQAPFTVSGQVGQLSPAERAALRRACWDFIDACEQARTSIRPRLALVES